MIYSLRKSQKRLQHGHEALDESNDGRRVVLGNRIYQIEKLGNCITEPVTERLLPQAISSYDAGNTLDFGPLSLSSQGIGKQGGSKVLSWPELKNIRNYRGVLNIQKEGDFLPWAAIPGKNIPNVFVFLGVIQHTLQKKQ